jgi:hypothetical protein
MAMPPTDYKIIKVPVTVPRGPYCWQFSGGINTPICEYFDNEGGHNTCTLGLGWYIKERDDAGVLKAKECRKLSQ